MVLSIPFRRETRGDFYLRPRNSHGNAAWPDLLRRMVLLILTCVAIGTEGRLQLRRCRGYKNIKKQIL